MNEGLQVKNVSDLVLLWAPDDFPAAYAAMAADLDKEPHVPRDWARRGRIPADQVDAVVNAAHRRGFLAITHAVVLHVSRPRAVA